MISIQITDYTLHWRTIELCLSDHIENAINYRCERNNGKIDRSRFLACLNPIVEYELAFNQRSSPILLMLCLF